MQTSAEVVRGLHGKVTVACVASVASSLFPSAVLAFRRPYPDVRVHLHDHNGARVMAKVLDREVEFGVATLWEPMPDITASP